MNRIENQRERVCKKCGAYELEDLSVPKKKRKNYIQI